MQSNCCAILAKISFGVISSNRATDWYTGIKGSVAVFVVCKNVIYFQYICIVDRILHEFYSYFLSDNTRELRSR